MAGWQGKEKFRATAGKWQLFPLLRIAFFLAAGIITGEALGNTNGLWAWMVTMVVASVAALAAFRHKQLQSLLIFLTIALMGVVVSLLQQKRDTIVLPLGKTMFKAVVTSEPQQRGNFTGCDLLIVAGELSGRKVRASFYCDSTKGNGLRPHAGDGLIAASVVEKPRNYSNSNFDYVKYLKVHGISATTTVWPNGWRKLKVELGGVPLLERARIAALRLRQKMVDDYRHEGIGGNELAVMAALTLGDRSIIDRRLRDDYSISGGAHILAMSGMHLSVIYALIVMMWPGGRRRLATQVVAMVTVWAFVFLAGMSPSLLRSGLMLTVFAFVTLLNRNSMSLNALALAAIVMMGANPKCIHDVGFQMSFMAVLFILLLLPSMEEWVGPSVKGNAVAKHAWSLAAVAIVAQLGVLPLVVYYFGRIPCYFLLTNFIVVPCVTALLYGAVGFFVLVPLRHLIAPVLSAIAGTMNGSLAMIARLPGASIENVSINGWQTLLAYVLLFLIFLLIKKLKIYI
ncbi:MAG: ComEC/Rec2 family competence protein [Prevotella sp.]|nr:ComEC/Rec2 family competence protein [Prevotella sp.]